VRPRTDFGCRSVPEEASGLEAFLLESYGWAPGYLLLYLYIDIDRSHILTA
jgi:hypothetical protein